MEKSNMDNFRQWYTDGNVFHRETKLYFGESGQNGLMHLWYLLLLASGTAVEDYSIRGLGFEFLQEHNVAILLSRLSFKIEELPKDNDEITIRTWEEPPVGLQLSRKFEITETASGRVLLTGSTLWLLVNLATRRITKPADFTLRPTPSHAEPYNGVPCGKITFPENAEVTVLGERTIYLSDLDGNGHVNNSRYAAFALDHLPPEYQNKAFTGFRVNYSKEARLGDTLRIEAAFDNANRTFVVVGRHETEACFEAQFYY